MALIPEQRSGVLSSRKMFCKGFACRRPYQQYIFQQIIMVLSHKCYTITVVPWLAMQAFRCVFGDIGVHWRGFASSVPLKSESSSGVSVFEPLCRPRADLPLCGSLTHRSALFPQTWFSIIYVFIFISQASFVILSYPVTLNYSHAFDRSAEFKVQSSHMSKCGAALD